MLRDSVLLQEDDEHYVSRPMEVAGGPGKSFLISDGYANSVLHFDSAGHFVQEFGRSGQGPGEFRGVGAFYVNSEIVGAVDVRGMKIEFFDYASGESIGTLDLPETLKVTRLSELGDSVWIFGMDRGSWMSIGTVSHAALMLMASQRDADVAESLRPDRVTVPRPYQLSEFMFAARGETYADIGSSDAVVGFLSTPYVLVVDGTDVDTLHLAPRERHGMPTEQEMRDDGLGDPRFVIDHRGDMSSLISLSRDQSGNILLVHQDLTIEASDPSTGFRVTGIDYYVSSLSPDGTRQCADTPVPLSGVGTPRAALVGSELMVVDQVVQSATSVVTVIRRYVVDATMCDGEVS